MAELRVLQLNADKGREATTMFEKEDYTERCMMNLAGEVT